LRSLLTVSELALQGDEADRALRRWVDETSAFNAELGLTGGLIAARTQLAEIIEGEREAIETSLCRARSARHHARFTIVDSKCIERRAFDSWKLFYEGHSTYVASPIAALLEAQDAYHSERLRGLMEAFGNMSVHSAATGASVIGKNWNEGESSRLRLVER